jgi:hypothetical protein
LKKVSLNKRKKKKKKEPAWILDTLYIAILFGNAKDGNTITTALTEERKRNNLHAEQRRAVHFLFLISLSLLRSAYTCLQLDNGIR